MHNQNELGQQVTAFLTSQIIAASFEQPLLLPSCALLVFKLLYTPIAWTPFFSLFSLSNTVTLFQLFPKAVVPITRYTVEHSATCCPGWYIHFSSLGDKIWRLKTMSFILLHLSFMNWSLHGTGQMLGKYRGK